MFSSPVLHIAVRWDNVTQMCWLSTQTVLPETWPFQVTEASLSAPAILGSSVHRFVVVEEVGHQMFATEQNQEQSHQHGKNFDSKTAQIHGSI